MFNTLYPEDTDVLKTSSGRLKKDKTSYDQTRLCHGVWQRTSDLQSLKTSDLRRFEDVQFTISSRRLFCDVFKTVSKHHLCSNIVATSKEMIFPYLVLSEYSENFKCLCLSIWFKLVCCMKFCELFKIL